MNGKSIIFSGKGGLVVHNCMISWLGGTAKQLITKRLGTTGLVVKAEDAQSRGRGFEPRHHILDGCKPKSNKTDLEKFLTELERGGDVKAITRTASAVKNHFNVKGG